MAECCVFTDLDMRLRRKKLTGGNTLEANVRGPSQQEKTGNSRTVTSYRAQIKFNNVIKHSHG